MEDAQIKAGNGLVDRITTSMSEENHGMSVAEYAKMRNANRPGNEIYETAHNLKERQKPLRKFLEGRVRKLVAEDLKRR